MTKDDLIKLAMPASIALLALSLVAAPMVVKAHLDSGDVIYVKPLGGWEGICK